MADARLLKGLLIKELVEHAPHTYKELLKKYKVHAEPGQIIQTLITFRDAGIVTQTPDGMWYLPLHIREQYESLFKMSKSNRPRE